MKYIVKYIQISLFNFPGLELERPTQVKVKKSNLFYNCPALLSLARPLMYFLKIKQPLMDTDKWIAWHGQFITSMHTTMIMKITFSPSSQLLSMDGSLS